MAKNAEFYELMETQLTPEMMKPEYQEELFQLITKTPESFRAVIEQQGITCFENIQTRVQRGRFSP